MTPEESSGLRQRLAQFEKYTIDVVYDRRRGSVAQAYGTVLRGFSWLFLGAVKTRRWLYSQRLLQDQPLGCPVIVVGNLTVGGTGKTPVVEHLAQRLKQRGRRVVILSRGYGRKASSAKRGGALVVSDGERIRCGAVDSGDEPQMLARNLHDIPIVVGKDRVEAGRFAIREFGADVLLLDDGLQYLPLKGHLNLLLIDKTNPFGNGHLLPRGILREPVRHLAIADYVVLTKCDGRPDALLRSLLKRYGKPDRTVECTHGPRSVEPIGPGESRELGWLCGRRVAIFSGIATPESFEKTVRELGAEIVVRHHFADHQHYHGDEIRDFARLAEQRHAEAVLTTEKDAVRTQPEWFTEGPPAAYLRVEVKILAGQERLDQALAAFGPEALADPPQEFSRV